VVAQLFVSHSSADNDLAAAVRDCLADLGYESVFLDFDPTGGLVPGQAWRDQLFTNLDACDAVVFITTPKSNASQWCHSELALTRWLRKPILALLVDGCAPHPLTEDLQGLKVTADTIDRDRVRAALVGLGLDQEARWDASRSPFPGLRAFDESYAAVFFGRDRQIDQLRQLVDPPSRSRDGAIIPVLGPSGSGKSSLVRAGLVPALRVTPEWVITEPWTPSDVPLAEMSLALAHAAKLSGADLDADRCQQLLNTAGGMADYVRELRASGRGSAETKILVVVDQAEELVTMTAAAERQAFLEALTTSCTAPSPLRVVMTARTDMWDKVAAETGKFAMSVAPTVLHVPPLTRADLAEVISEPARRSHLTLEDGLVQRLVEDTGSGEALPLLAFTLARMATDADDRRLTHAEYDAIGGVKGAIASRAAEVATGGRTEEEVAEAILHLVNLSDATPHKRLARADDVPPDHRAILDDLVDARLVVINEVNDQQVYAPAHESLFSAWPPLVDLIEHRRDDLLLRARLERRAADWKDAGATSSGLLSGLELDQARDWEGRSGDLATPDVRAYVAASGARQQRTRMVRISVGAVVAVLVAALVVTLLVNSSSNHRLAETSKRLATNSRVDELAAIALAQQTSDPVAAAIALVEGLQLDEDSPRLRDQAKTLLTAPGRDVLRTEGATLVAGGSVILSAGTGETTVWDRATGKELGTLPQSVATTLRPDGRIAILASGEGLQSYDLGAGAPRELAAFGSPASTVTFSPDGSILLEETRSQVLLWDLRDPAAPRLAATWFAPPRPLNALAVLDDGTVLASSGQDLLISWAGLGGAKVTTIQAQQDPNLNPSVIVPDGAGSRALVAGPSVSTGQPLVDLRSGRVLQTFKASGGEFEFSNVLATTWTSTMDLDGERVAAFDLAGRGFLFSARDGSYLGALIGHGDLVQRAQFTSDGLLFSGGLDGTVRTWDPHAAEIDTSGSLVKALCTAFGEHMDADSWKLAMGKKAFDPPCPSSAAKPAAPPPLGVDNDILDTAGQG
jgi:WD40 repeat protein